MLQTHDASQWRVQAQAMCRTPPALNIQYTPGVVIQTTLAYSSPCALSQAAPAYIVSDAAGVSASQNCASQLLQQSQDQFAGKTITLCQLACRPQMVEKVVYPSIAKAASDQACTVSGVNFR